MEAKTVLQKLTQGQNLTTQEAYQFLVEVMKGNTTPVQIGAILTAFRIKGETTDEIVGFIRAMRDNMIGVDAPGAFDICGTGDGSYSFNISTTVAFVLAGAGLKVAKHGGRAASSRCGSADVLEALGVRLTVSPKQAEQIYRRVGMIFLFAPLFHPAMKQVAGVRKELGIRTVFNFLGPFTNPASAKRQLVGVPNVDIAQKLAAAATHLEYDHLCIVTSIDRLDEVSIFGKTEVFEVKGKTQRKFFIDPKKFGFKNARQEEILGKGPNENARIIQEIFDGQKSPRRDIVVLNAALALCIAGAAKDLKQGIIMAQDSIDKGKARIVLETLVRETQKYEKHT